MNATRFAAFLIVGWSWYNTSIAVTIPTVEVGNPGNQADTRYVDWYHPDGVGSVGYSFSIGKTEITNAQYAAYLNAVAASDDPYSLYSASMASDTRGGILRSGVSGNFSYAVKPAALGGTYAYDNKPVVFVSWGDAARFANWLHNGQPIGAEDAATTEDGAYTLNGATTNAAFAAVARNPGARWWLPDDDEWYKAAYHKNDGVTDNYWDYPTRTDSLPNSNPPAADTGNSANYRDATGNYATGDGNLPLTDAGAYALSGSPYDTFDQGGNVWEWTETPDSACCGISRAGGWSTSSLYLRASSWDDTGLANQFDDQGFRIATTAVPETNSFVLVISAVAFLFGRRVRTVRLPN